MKPKETIREQIDRELRENCTLIDYESDSHCRVWVCKEKFDYDAFYEVIIEMNKSRLKRLGKI